MQVKQVGEESMMYEPQGDDESQLVTALFERITEHRPDWPMGDRTDLAMSLFTVFKKWAHELGDTKAAVE